MMLDSIPKSTVTVNQTILASRLLVRPEEVSGALTLPSAVLVQTMCTASLIGDLSPRVP